MILVVIKVDKRLFRLTGAILTGCVRYSLQIENVHVFMETFFKQSFSILLNFAALVTSGSEFQFFWPFEVVCFDTTIE